MGFGFAFGPGAGLFSLGFLFRRQRDSNPWMFPSTAFKTVALDHSAITPFSVFQFSLAFWPFGFGCALTLFQESGIRTRDLLYPTEIFYQLNYFLFLSAPFLPFGAGPSFLWPFCFGLFRRLLLPASSLFALAFGDLLWAFLSFPSFLCASPVFPSFWSLLVPPPFGGLLVCGPSCLSRPFCSLSVFSFLSFPVAFSPSSPLSGFPPVPPIKGLGRLGSSPPSVRG